MGLVHQLFGIRILEVFDLVVTVQTALLLKPTRPLDQGGFQARTEYKSAGYLPLLS